MVHQMQGLDLHHYFLYKEWNHNLSWNLQSQADWSLDFHYTQVFIALFFKCFIDQNV